MKVALAIPAFLPAVDYGGPVQKIRRLYSALRTLGIELTVVTSTLAGIGDNSLRTGAEIVEGIPVLRLPTPVAYRFSPWVYWTGLERFDVMHVLGAWNGLSYAALTLGQRVAPTVVWEPVGMLVARGRHAFLKQQLSKSHHFLASRTSGLIWTSRREQEEAGMGDHHRAFFRPNPCELFDPSSLPDRQLARQELRLDSPGPLWGYLGRIDQRKGIELLLQAWPGRSAGTLLIAGPTGDARLVDRARASDGSVRLLGPISSSERWRYLRALDALVLVPEYGENFGNVVIEAMQVGTPVLASPAVGALDWIDDPGVRVVRSRAELEDAFRTHAIPPPPHGSPAACDARRVALLQQRIYYQAMGSC